MRSLIGSWIFENLNKNLGNHRRLDRGCMSGADASFSLTPLDSVTVEHGDGGMSAEAPVGDIQAGASDGLDGPACHTHRRGAEGGHTCECGRVDPC